MATGKLSNIFKKQVKFLLFSFLFIAASLVGILLFSLYGFYVIHPSLYLVTLTMGIGWGATALVSIHETYKGNLH